MKLSTRTILIASWRSFLTIASWMMSRGSKPWGSRFEGKQNVREALATRFEGLPDVHYGNDEHFVDSTADTGISKWTLTGTTREGTRKEVQGCDFYTFRNGKVIRKDSYWKIVD